MSNDIETELLNAINEGNYNKVNSMLIVNQIHATEKIDGKPLLVHAIIADKANIVYIASEIDNKLILTNNGREPIYIENLLINVLL